MSKETKIILVESQANVRNVLIYILESEFNFEVIDFDKIDIAINFIKLTGEEFSFIISDSGEYQDQNAILFQVAVDKFGKIPFIVTSKTGNTEWAPYNKHSVQSYLSKDEVIKGIKDIVTKQFEIKEQREEVSKFTSISFKTLCSLDHLEIDCYIKLRSGRLLKLFKEGDKIDSQDYLKYSKKGITELYIRKDAHIWILKAINKYAKQIVEDENFNIKQKHIEEAKEEELNQTQGDNIVSKKDIENPFHFEQDFIDKMYDRMNEIVSKMKKNKKLGELLKKINIDREESKYIKNRIGLMINISSAILKELKWDSSATYEKMCYVIHMHDITLIKEPELAKYLTRIEFESDENLTEEQKEKIKNHTKESSRLAQEDSRSPSDSHTILLQHHERPDGSGFPYGHKGSRIAPFAALLHVSLCFAQYILDNENWNFQNFLVKNKSKFRGGQYSKVFMALEKLKVK